MLVEAGFKETKTNHSLRATGATTLVPERIIQQNTGQRSLEALRKYERVSVRQREATSRVLTTIDQNASFSKEVMTVSKSHDFTLADEEIAKTKGSDLPMFYGCSIDQISIYFNQGYFILY